MRPENFIEAAPLMAMVSKAQKAPSVDASSEKNAAAALPANSNHKKTCACLDCCN